MRGLTAEERLWLSLPAGEYTDTEMYCPPSLVELGRVSHFIEADDQGEIERWPNTDLGNLALRVCPVDE